MLSWYHGWREDEWREGLAIRPAERWRFTVRLKRPHGNANPHGFDYEAWLFERGLRATGYVRPRAVAQRLDDFVLQPAYVIERLRDRIRRSFAAVLPEAPYVGILAALAIGDQQAIPAAAVAPVPADRGDAPDVDLRPARDDGGGAVCGLVGWLWRRSERLMLFLPAPKAAIAAGWLAAFGYSLLAGFAVPTQRTCTC
jgi:competence protein ComEC